MPLPDPWSPLVNAAATAAATLPPLPGLDEVRHGDPERWFAELGYTFWSRELLDALAARCRSLPVLRWLELAAGTGRLSAELARRGVRVAATDNHAQASGRVRSFQRPIRYGAWVGEMDAREAVAALRPDAAICAWPPLGSGLIPDLLLGRVAGGEGLRVALCIGEPGGATEAPETPDELPHGWRLERWPECERLLIGFTDPPYAEGFRSHSALMIYRRL